MTAECGICEFKGPLKDAPLFVCFNCGDAIRRLVWIREQEFHQMPNVALESKSQSTSAGIPKIAAQGKRQ